MRIENMTKYALIIGIVGVPLSFLAMGRSTGYRESRIESRAEFEVQSVNSCKIDDKNYVILNKAFSRDIYIQQDDGSYVRLDKKLQDDLNNEKKGLIKRIEEESGSEVKAEMEGRK